MTTPTTTPKLTVDPDHETYGGGTVTYRVTVDGRWIGWVGDQRPWRGWRYGGRQWWACWREDGDTAARWNSFGRDGQHKTRAAALADLLEHARDHVDVSGGSGASGVTR